MKKNVGQMDRSIRLFLGVVLIMSFFVLDGPIKWISLLGIVLIITAFIKVCPLYLPFKIDTSKFDRNK